MRALHFLETSAVNLFADELNDFDFNHTYREIMEVEFCISPITLWEILLNSDDARKDRLIYWSQFNCANYLLKSPQEIVLDYITDGAPEEDRNDFLADPATKLEIGETWKEIHGKTDRTIPIDLEALKQRSLPLRELSRIYKPTLVSMGRAAREGKHDVFHGLMLRVRSNLAMEAEQSEGDDRLVKMALILAFLLVCIGVELDNSPVRTFWADKTLEDPFERLDYLVDEVPRSIVRGPLIEMALMFDAQGADGSKPNRGSAFDALQMIYCYYTDNTVSNDPHFLAFRKEESPGIFDRIIPARDYISMLKLGHKLISEERGS